MRPELRDLVESALRTRILALRPVTGGDVNEAYRLETPEGPIFLKTRRAAPGGMFAAEARGLDWLAEADALRTPKVRARGEEFLALEWIESGPAAAASDEALGRGLARLHRHGAAGWGAVPDNFIAVVPQDNAGAASWAEFYRERRLRPLRNHPRVAPLLEREDRRAFERLDAVLEQRVGPELAPARLHGDLWSGNRMVDASGAPVLVDPAAYGGHPEMDLAMMKLFGGFSDRVFAAYHELAPPLVGAAERGPLWQLYPLLVHVALFGASYVAPLRRALATQL